MNIGSFQSDKSWNKSENDKLGALPEKKTKKKNKKTKRHLKRIIIELSTTPVIQDISASLEQSYSTTRLDKS